MAWVASGIQALTWRFCPDSCQRASSSRPGEVPARIKWKRYDDPEALALFREGTTGKPGGDRQSEAKSIGDNVTNGSEPKRDITVKSAGPLS